MEVSHMEHEVNHQSYKQKGIPLLMFLLEEHVEMTEIYFMLLSLLLKNGTVFGNELMFVSPWTLDVNLTYISRLEDV